jgi:uncharacterized protein (PEP-CTERM system associated)
MVVTGGNKKKALYLKACLLVLSVLQSTTAYSAGWVLSPGVMSSISYVDNVDLSAGPSTPSAYILQINPSISFQRTGSRLLLDFDYTLQNLFYSYNDPERLDNEDDYKTYHQLATQAKAELVEKILFLDAGASYSQQNASGQDPASFDNLSLSANRSNVKTLSVSPYVRQRLGSTANVELRYRYNRFTDDVNTVNDAHIRETSLLVNNGKRFDRLGWVLTAQRRKIDYAEQQDTLLSTAGMRFTYKLFSRISLLATAGHEENEYIQLESASTEGNYWTAGILWNPSQRTSLSAETGRRYFGRTSAFSFNHRTKHTVWSAKYAEDITNQSLIQTETQLVQIGVTAPSAGDPGGQPIYIELSRPILASGTVLRRSATAGMTMKLGKSNLNLNLSKIRYEYQLSTDEEELLVADLSLQWDLSSKAKLMFTSYNQQRKLLTSNEEELLRQLKMAYQKDLKKNVLVQAEYRHARNETDSGLREYKQNAIELGVTMKF